MKITPDNAHSVLEAAGGLKASYERKAGKKARTNREAVNRELTEATDVFAASDWSNLTLTQVAEAAARIKKLATNLAALESVEHYDKVMQECLEVLDS